MSITNKEIIDFLLKAEEKGMHLFLEDEKLKYSIIKNKAVDTKFLSDLKNFKNEIIEFLKNESGSFENINFIKSKIVPVKRKSTERIPLSYSQERLWFIDRLEGSLQYHIPAVLRLKGKLSIKALGEGISLIMDRHEILRTVIREEAGQAYQYIKPKAEGGLQRVDGSRFKGSQKLLEQYIVEAINRPFDLSQDDMLRAELISLNTREHMLVVTLHHIASDGWSTSVMVKELTEYYNACEEGRPAELEGLTIQYADYSIWQRKYLQGELLERKLSYWVVKLMGSTPLELPTDHPRGSVQSIRGGSMDFAIDNQLTESLQSLSQRYNTTMFMTLLAGFKVLLFRYTGQTDICVGTPIAGRQHQETENLIGFFVNTLALRSTVSGDAGFSQFLDQVRGTTIEAYEHQEVPFEKVVEAVVKERDLSRNPLFQVMFIMQNTPDIPEIQLKDLVLSGEHFEGNLTQFDLSFTATHSEESLSVSVEYSSDLYKESTIERMLEHYGELLNSIVKEPDKEVSQLRMLTLSEEQQILKTFNNTKTAYPKDKTITELFEQQAARTPKAIALVYEDQQLTYGELNTKANQLAHYLQLRGVEPQTLVPICIERSMEMIIGMLGVLKSGGAYVPIDPEYPMDRIMFMLEDTGARIVLVGKSMRGRVISENLEVIELTADWKNMRDMPTANIPFGVVLKKLAYVIYTSGSTGQPKGVMIEHGSLLNYVIFFKKYFSISSKDYVVQQSSISFDTSVEEIYPSLISGATICIIKEGGKDINSLRIEIEENRATILSTTPLVVEALSKELSGMGKLRYLISGGDVLHNSSISNLINRVSVANGYGPSETTVAVIFKKVRRESDTLVIGTPIANTTVRILSSSQELMPIGIPGEIHIGGVQLARGYLNNANLTKEKFIGDPFSKEVTSRLYKTGDMGRWLPDGNIEFLGRGDDQVKIRGYRIELGEIESAIQQSKMVSHSVVLAKEDRQGNKRLVSYVVPTGEFDKEILKVYLKKKLPDYMIPGIWVEMESLPITQNGKVDRMALPIPNLIEELDGQYVAPRDHTETKLAEIWQELLSLERVGVYDNFFELGGHSILATRVVSLIRKEFSISIPIRTIFEYTCISELGNYIKLIKPNSEKVTYAGVLDHKRKTRITNKEIIDFLLKAEEKGMHLFLERDKLKYSIAKGKSIDEELLTSIKSYKVEILEFLKSEAGNFESVNVIDNKIVPVKRKSTERIPLSYSQERLWFIDRLEGSLQYHIPAVLRLKGKLSIKALGEGISLIMDRHEILRTVICEETGQAYQYIKPKAEGGLQRVDGSRFKGSQKLLEQYIVEAINRPFDLSQDDMLRAELISLNTREHMLVVTLHHIASDGWSTSVMVKELTEYYNACEEGRPAALEGLTIQYADYSIWQRKYLQGELLERKLSYWVVKLMGSTPLELPTDHPRGSVQSIRGGSMDFAIDNQLTESLQSLSQRYNTTMFMTLLAGFKVLLFRYTGQTDICVGTPIAGRQHQETENLIGFFVNTLALRSTVSGDAGFSEFLDQVRGTTIEAYEHQEVPFEKVVEAVVKQRDLSRSALFQVMFIMQNTPDVPDLRLGEVDLEMETPLQETSKFEMTFSIIESKKGLDCSVEYCTDLYNAETIQRMTVHYTELLNSIVKEPDKEVSQLQMLTQPEQQQILKTFNNTKTTYPKDKTITELFEQQAAITPKAIALVYEDQQLTYGELNTKANQLAHYLRLRGIEPQTLVPICIERSMEMIIGILGILKSGGAYVPIDPEYPVERISYMLKDTKAKVVLSSKGSSDRLAIAKTGIIELDTERWKIDRLPTDNLQTTAGPSGLAYVIYTSGSTGQPKGVEMPQGALVNLLLWQDDQFANHQRKVLQFASLNFDVSFQDIFSTLCFGSSLYLIRSDRRLDISELLRDIVKNEITHLFLPSVILKNLAESHVTEQKLSLEEIMVAGDQLKVTLDIKAFLNKRKIKLINHYGPTEAHVVSSYEIQLNRAGIELPPIGKPIANTTVYILDKNHHPVPIGIPGEIHIGGVQLARGYLNNAKLTKEKFIRDPFSKEVTSRLYKTGDIGRWLPDGNIEFLGRGDDQVKIRGYRIELGEIESAIQQSKMVSHSVVLAKEDTQGNKRLVGYVVAKGKLDKEKLSSTLRQQLPEYMIPGIWVELESLPLTPNGKVDKRSLPDPDIDQQISRGYVAPGNATETKLAEIWQELLSVGRIGIHDNFFELGGHSLLAMRLISSIRRQMELELGVRDLFRFPTIGELSSHLSSGDTTELLPAIVSQPRPERIPLSYSQERLWFIDRLEGSLQYHIPAVLRLKGKLSIKALGEGISLIMDRHEILRTVIREEAGQAYQYIKPKAEGGLQRVDGSRFKGSQKLLEQYIVEAINRPFDLSQDDMLRAELISLNTREHMLVVTLHHIASDGWSTSVMVKELTEYYNACEEGRPAELEGLTIQYADYSIWQRKYLQGELLERKLSYWVVKLMGSTPLELPTDHPRGSVQSIRGGSMDFAIDNQLTESLQSLSQRYNTTMFMTLLAGFKVLLFRYTGQTDICVGTPIAGRQHHQTENLIGFFVNTLALRSTVSGDAGFSEFLDQVRGTTIEAYEHQEVPFEKVVEAVVKERDLSRNPLFQVMFIMQNTPDIPDLRLGKVDLEMETPLQETSKFEMTFSIIESKKGLDCSVEYCTDLYNAETIQRMTVHYTELLNSIVKEPDKEVSQLRMLTPAEQQQILKTFNNTKTRYPKDKTITELFEQQAARTPKAIALVYEDQQLTYGDLNTKANQLAHYLRLRGVKSETLVPICIERSMDMIIGILGILKSGGAYVPIDPEYPVERISYMLKDTKAKVVLSSKGSSNRLSIAKTGIIELDTDRGKIDKLPTENLQTTAGPSGLAYVIYTSGSTGQPKGVMVEHEGLSNYLLTVKERYTSNVNGGSGSFLNLSITFDASITSLFIPLISGKSLVVGSGQSIEMFEEQGFLEKAPYDFMKITPLHMEFLQSKLQNFKGRWLTKKLIIGGETLQRKHFNSIIDGGLDIEIINEYGPTEATVGCTSYSFNTFDDSGKIKNSIAIGKPFNNIKIYILSGQMLQPIGIPGEIHIGGVQLARGYLNNAKLTKEKFIRDPFSKEGTSRLYKTGDIGRWLPDGNIEFLGRGDDQVKIRGYRIELGEIESAIQQSKMVSHSVVLAKEDTQGNKRLVGYVVAKGKLDKEKLSSTLRQQLPEYMVPGIWVELESLPLTPNGKVDKRSLPDPDIDQQISQGYVAPGNATETKLAEIWQELLSVGRIGIHDNFFELGGHSLLAMRLISSIRRQMELELGVRDLFRFPTIGELSSHLSSGDTTELLPAIVSQPRPERIPLSYSQERLWFIDRLEGSLQYHIPAVLRLKGKLSIKALSEGISLIMDRHEILRTVIREEAGQAYQYIKPKAEGGLQRVDGSRFKGSQKLLEQYIVEAINRPFDLSQDDMLRAELISLNTREHILVVTLHHIASDGWSTSVMVKELTEYYNACEEGRPAELEGLTIQYADYSIWQRKYLQGELLERKLSYWVVKLMGSTPLELPTDHPRGSVQSIRGGSMDFAIDNQLTGSLQSLSQRYNTTMFMTLLAGFKVLLFRYTGQTDICVGTPIAGRQHHQTENLIGFFVNTLALRSTISGDAGFSEFLDQVRGTTIEAYEHQEVPFEKVVEAVVKERDLSRNPLFQVMFIMQNTPDIPDLRLGKVDLEMETPLQETSKFEMTFSIIESKKGLDCSVEYCTDLYNAETIQRMTVHYTELLNSIVKEPDKEVSQLHMLTPAEQQQILKTFNNTKTAYPKDKTITDLFEQQAAMTPKAIALVYEDQQLTYGELNTKANQLAHYLRLRGVEPQTLVPICIERGMDMIIGILGILKSGGAYVPIDPEYPVERISYMLKDTKAKVVLSSKSSSNRLSIAKTGIIELDTERGKIDKLPTENLQTGVNPSGLAYVIYTSGSTGQPKGVMVEHGNVVRLFKTETPVFDFNEKDVWTMFHSFCFDFSVWEMFGALLYGGRLVIVPREATLDTLLFVELMKSQRVTVLNQTPSAFYVLQDSVRQSGAKLSVRYVIFGGEALNPAKLHPWKAEYGDCRLINMYGITETTVHVTYREIDREQIETGRSIIGKPIPTLTSYILDKNNHPVPIGIPGEIHIGGAGLARGYLNNAKLTKEKFIRDPFSKEGTSRLYKTGDIGRWLPDGNIEFLGRGDDQVKIRGYRIELGEIESAIQQSKMVSHSVVLAKEDTQGNKRLVGYVVAKGKLDKEKLSSTLRQQLPEYMVPGIWVELESLPLTPNGKVDKRSLPDPDIDQQISQGYVAPGNATETKLAEIWQELLSVGRIGIHDNFFELGGHSLLAMRLISSIRRQMELELGVRDLFRFPTIGELSSHLSSGDTTELLPAIVSQPRPERIPLSYSQERLWFIDRLEGSLQYHIPAVLRLKGKLSIKALSEGISLIMDRHEILRTVIREEAGQAYQYIKPKAEGGLQRVDGSRFKGSQKLLEQYIVEAINRPFDLSQDDMLRAELISLNTREHMLVVTLHHIASDGWSTSVMVKELTEYYNACEEGRPAELEGLTIQYADYSIWQRKYLQGELLERKLSYWVVKLMGSTPLELPTDHPRGSVQSIRGGSMDFAIDNQLTESLQSLSQRYNTTMFMTLLAGFKVLLFRYTGQTDICVGTPIAGRQHHQTENLIGFFVNTLALRSTLSSEAGFSEFLDQVRGTTIEAYEHQEVPFEKVVEAVVKERDLSRNPLFQVMFIMQNTPDIPDLRLGKVDLEMETPLQETSKFEMTFSIIESKKGLDCSVEYCTDLYNAETIQRMTVHYTELLNSIVKEPDKEVSQLHMLTPAEQQQILKTFNNTKTAYPKDKTITDLFEQQAAMTPKAIALVYEDQQLTYGELNTKANQLAHYLRLRGVEPQTLVPICIERGMDMIIGILGILKSGGAYVPIDPEYPVERISYMLKDTKAKVVLSSKSSSNRLSIAKTGIIELDTERWKIDKLPTENLQTGATPSGLAYVIYTSGSTGQPKGVMVEHGGVVNLIKAQSDYFKITVKDRILQFSNYSFDASVEQIFLALTNGASLIMFEQGLLFKPGAFEDFIIQQRITHLHATPNWIENLEPKGYKGLKRVIAGGDLCKRELAERWGDRVNFYNEYGPTETTVTVIEYKEQSKETENHGPYPIGKPIANTTVYILDKENHPVPIGIPGEIHIGGVQLARGYLNNAELTKEKFIRDPFSKEVTSRLYKTGDIGRWLPDGNIEFLGRGDDQVKIRGYRIELGEIESAIQQSKIVSHSVVLAKEDTQGNKRLVGYVVAKGELDKEKLSSTLRQKLPEYMIPGIWVEMESLPLTPNGKVDKRSLPDPDIDQQISRGYVAPGTATETKLADIWQELLSVGRIGIHDNFFELGGHSILALRMLPPIKRLIHTELELMDLVVHPTIAELASILDAQVRSEIKSEEKSLPDK